MSWLDKCELMLNNPLLDESRLSYIRSVHNQLLRGCEPTEPQLTLLERFWTSHLKRAKINKKKLIEEFGL